MEKMNLKKRISNILENKILLIILLASAMRLLFLAKVPPSLNWDEISMGYSAYSIADTARDEWGQFMPLFFRSYGEWKSPVYIYLLVPFIKIFGLNAWGVRLPTSLAGIGVVYLTYLLTKKIFNEKAALWASFFLAISPWHFLLSRPAFEAGVSLLLMLLGIYQLILSSESKGYKHIVLSAIFFGLGPHTYNSSKIVTPFLVLWLVYVLRNKLKPKRIAMLLGILAIFAIPILQNILSGKAQFRYTQVGITTAIEHATVFYEHRFTFPLPDPVSRILFSKYSYFAYKLVDNLMTYFSPAFLVTSGGGHTQHGIPYRGVLLVSEFTLALYGLLKLSKQKSPLRFLPLVILFLGFIPPSTTRESYHVLRSILAIPGWQMLAGLGGYYFAKNYKKYLKPLYWFIALEFIILTYSYFVWYPHAFARDWQYGYKQAFEYTESVKDKYDEIVFTKWYGEPQFFLGFYSKMDPHEYQELNKPLIRYEEEGRLWLDQLESYKFGKYRFEYISWPGSDVNPRRLYVGKFDDFPEGADILKTIYFPDGEVAFNIVEGP